MIKTGRIEKGRSHDELTGTTSDAIKAGRAVDTARGGDVFLELPSDIALEGDLDAGHVPEAAGMR